MSDVKWIKIVTDIFDDEKILLIESMPEADAIIVIWFKLLCLAGKNNNKGVFTLSDKIAYNDEMLAAIFRRPLNTVRLALNTFEKYRMIEIIEGVITIPNWGKHQTLDQIENRREYQRQYMAKKREEQKLLAEGNYKPNCKPNSKTNVSPIEGEEEKEEDLDIDLDKDIKDKEENSNEFRLSKFLFNHIKKNNPGAKEPNIKSWIKQFDYILRVDGREVDEVKQVIKWSQEDDFWYKNILSPLKLRKHYDTLTLQMKNPKRSNKKNGDVVTNFNSYEGQREYDFDDLEKKLLGYDKENL